MNYTTTQAFDGMPDQRLVHVLLDLLRDGPRDVEWLAQRARSRLRDVTVDEDAVISTVVTCTLLVGRPDGSVARLLDLLEGQVLTHRVGHIVRGQRALWTGLALMPLVAWSDHEPLILATGGAVVQAEFGHTALVGPPGWLPPCAPGELLGFRLGGARLSVERIDPDRITVDADRDVRTALAAHYRNEESWAEDELATRPGALNRAIGFGLLERPDLLSSPVSPLNELLYDALHEADRVHQFRDRSAWEAGDCVSFGIDGMPEYLYAELSRRATRYGMSLDQFVILALGHLAWRTPFAEDLGEWENWGAESCPDSSGRRVIHLSRPE